MGSRSRWSRFLVAHLSGAGLDNPKVLPTRCPLPSPGSPPFHPKSSKLAARLSPGSLERGSVESKKWQLIVVYMFLYKSILLGFHYGGFMLDLVFWGHVLLVWLVYHGFVSIIRSFRPSSRTSMKRLSAGGGSVMPLTPATSICTRKEVLWQTQSFRTSSRSYINCKSLTKP